MIGALNCDIGSAAPTPFSRESPKLMASEQRAPWHFSMLDCL
jgi:hypothetical protein